LERVDTDTDDPESGGRLVSCVIGHEYLATALFKCLVYRPLCNTSIELCSLESFVLISTVSPPPCWMACGSHTSILKARTNVPFKVLREFYYVIKKLFANPLDTADKTCLLLCTNLETVPPDCPLDPASFRIVVRHELSEAFLCFFVVRELLFTEKSKKGGAFRACIFPDFFFF
jgi:hypothetical protein